MAAEVRFTAQAAPRAAGRSGQCRAVKARQVAPPPGSIWLVYEKKNGQSGNGSYMNKCLVFGGKRGEFDQLLIFCVKLKNVGVNLIFYGDFLKICVVFFKTELVINLQFGIVIKCNFFSTLRRG